MKNRIVACILVMTLISGSVLSGCNARTVAVKADENTENLAANASSQSSDEEPDATEANGTETEDEAEVTTGGSPWIDSDIKENITDDIKTNPKDDLHLYANKNWILTNDIPSGHAEWSHYSECQNATKDKCIKLLSDSSISGHDADLVRSYDKALLDWDARSKAGVTEISGLFEKLSAVKNTKDMDALMTDPDFLLEDVGLVSYGAELGLNDQSKYLIAVMTPELLLNDSAEYKERSEFGDMYYGFNKDAFLYLAKKLGLSEEDAEQTFENALEFETKLSESIMTTEETSSDDYLQKINNEMTFDELTALCKNFPVGEILKADKYAYDGKYLVVEPEYLKMLDSLYSDENIDGIKSYSMVHYVLNYSKCLDKETYDHMVDLQNKHFGTSGRLTEEEMAYNWVSSDLMTSMQKVYIEKYGSEEEKQKMRDLCQQVKDTYREILTENDWLSDEGKKAAIQKLDKMEIHAAYPDKFRDTSDLDLDGCSLIEASRRIDEWNADYDRNKVGKAPDREMWSDDFDILSCNAFYDMQQNTINMIIGMMDEPFFSKEMSTEELYASIGAFWAGHEISHAFDNDGAQFDGDGNLKDWWTKEDKEEFKKRTKKVDDYLDAIVAFDGKHITGSNVDTELIADMTGLECALKMASKVENFDYDKFFKKYAELNCSIVVYSQELTQLSQDVHPLNFTRTNVPAQQFDEFYKTYDVKQGDKMYLAPEDRLVIW